MKDHNKEIRNLTEAVNNLYESPLQRVSEDGWPNDGFWPPSKKTPYPPELEPDYDPDWTPGPSEIGPIFVPPFGDDGEITSPFYPVPKPGDLPLRGKEDPIIPNRIRPDGREVPPHWIDWIMNQLESIQQKYQDNKLHEGGRSGNNPSGLDHEDIHSGDVFQIIMKMMDCMDDPW